MPLTSPRRWLSAASLAASLLRSPGRALAAELSPESHGHVGDALQAVSYEPLFDIFDRSIIGRAPQGVEALGNNQAKALNLEPGATACYVVESGVIFGQGGGSGNKTLYLSANTCLQPTAAAAGNDRPSPPQLMLTVSNSTGEAGCRKPTGEPKDGEGKVFNEGAVMFSLNATGDVYVGITAPNVSSGFQGVYNFEIAASVDGYVHRYENRSGPQLLWMDSDSSSALLVTKNLTEDAADTQRIMQQGFPYVLYVSNNGSTASNGMRHSACGLRNTAEMMADRQTSGGLDSPVRISMTMRGPGGLPKQQFHLGGLNASSPYRGTLVRRAGGPAAREKRQENNALPGSVVFQATEFQTVSGTNCKVVTDLEFCNEIQYAVPGNDNRFNNTALAKAYDDYAKTMYSNFEKVMMQIPCEAPQTSMYSLARNCDDCKAAYKKWLCTVSIPRCEDFGSGNELALARNAGQAFPNGTRLAESVMAELQSKPYSMASRNSFVDQVIQPGPYKEILPCEDICYEVVQSCPAAMNFECPQPDMVSFGFSYGQRVRNGTTVSCNYPGEARTPTGGAGAPVPDARLLLSGLVVAAAVMVVG